MYRLEALASEERDTAGDPIREAIDQLHRALPKREDCTVLVDFLEDDLREGLSAIEEIEGHFYDVLEALGAARPSPIALIQASDDLGVLRRIEYLSVVAGQLKRRLSLAAGKLCQGFE